METTIAVYDSHEKAIEAVKQLKEQFPLEKISLVGEAQIIDDHIHVKSLEAEKAAPIAIGAVLGMLTGIFSGLGIFAVPGFGFLYGAGAIVGAMGGLDLGLISGGLVNILTNIGIKKDEVVKYEEHIRKGKFLIVAHGKEDEIKKAETVLRHKPVHI